MRRNLRLLFACLMVLGPFGVASQADAVTMKTTRFVAGFEGFYSCVYADPAGHATIGYGHLLHYGPPTKRDRKRWGCISKKRALRILRKDLRWAESELMKRLKGARVTADMVTALTSFTFNLGPGALDFNRGKGKVPTTNIAGLVRRGEYRRAGRQMLLFDGAIINGKRQELEGLRIRRRKEFRLMVRNEKPVTKPTPDPGSSGGLPNAAKSGGIGVG